MAELKFTFWLLQLTGYTAFLWSLFDSIGDIKSLILFLAGLTFAAYKIANAHLEFRRKQIDFEEYKRLKRKERELEKIKQELNDTNNNK